MSVLSIIKLKIIYAVATAILLLPFISNAQEILGGGDGGELGGAIAAIINFINGVLIPFLFAIGFFMFVWGVIKFFVIGGNNDEAKAEGKSLIIYALAGFVVILIFWGIVNIFANGIGLAGEGVDGVDSILPAGITN